VEAKGLFQWLIALWWCPYDKLLFKRMFSTQASNTRRIW